MSSTPQSVPGWRVLARRCLYFTLVILTTLAALALLLGVFAQDGLSPLDLGLLALYTLLMLWISTSFWTATIGSLILLFGGDRLAISALPPTRIDTAHPQSARTALVMPIYNEDPERVFAGLRAIYQSLTETGDIEGFDLFVLSDTRDPDVWLREQQKWYAMCCDFNAHGRIFYRNREKNISRKSGNLADFCKRWGGRYEYMIVLDADSVMGGTTLHRMVELMERHPGVALIQSPPIPVNHESLFARILQFASRLYGDMFAAGSNYWQLGDSNYWGHNAIIRIKPFVKHCGLPKLSGREPFGGEILSHDFVEAALLRKAGWEVWLGYDLKESYEELPTTLIDYAKRDRRWCQGNLQHVRMTLARGMDGISRLYFLMGIMSYLSSPLWLLFLVLTGFEAYVQSRTVPVYFFGDNIFPVWPESYTVEMTTVLLVTMAMLFLPKFLGLLVLFVRGPSVRAFGGVFRVTLSVLFETLFSTLIAPVLMLFQSKFVLSILMRRSVGWPTQQRGDHGLSWREAAEAHIGHTLIGIGAGVVSYVYVPNFFWWFIPVLAGLILSIPVSVLSSRSSLGRFCKRLGLFRTPEEFRRPRVLRLLDAALDTDHDGEPHRYMVLKNPGVCALHASLLPQRLLKKRERHQLKALLYQVVEDGPDGLSIPEQRALASSPEIVEKLHTLAWKRAALNANES